mmetsp:Transcript_10678/g.35446  ORF Transcript_10678/g.35446 Transcript_10678/m.35446 type:complete len:232 (-) Transcript_10678:263-958(-)
MPRDCRERLRAIRSSRNAGDLARMGLPVPASLDLPVSIDSRVSVLLSRGRGSSQERDDDSARESAALPGPSTLEPLLLTRARCTLPTPAVSNSTLGLVFCLVGPLAPSEGVMGRPPQGELAWRYGSPSPPEEVAAPELALPAPATLECRRAICGGAKRRVSAGFLLCCGLPVDCGWEQLVVPSCLMLGASSCPAPSQPAPWGRPPTVSAPVRHPSREGTRLASGEGDGLGE